MNAIVLAASTLLALQGTQTTPTTGSSNSAAELLGLVIERYHQARTITGTIVNTQTADGVRPITINTSFQFRRPAHLYIQQTTPDARRLPPGRWVVTSDGDEFSYSRPFNPSEPDNPLLRISEKVIVRGEILQVGDIVLAARNGLGDRQCPILDLVCAKTEMLQYLRGTWKSITEGPEEVYKGQKCRVIEGQYAANPALLPTGTYKIFINSGFDVVRYEVTEKFGALDPETKRQMEIAYTLAWDANLTLNGPVQEKLFTVVK